MYCGHGKKGAPKGREGGRNGEGTTAQRAVVWATARLFVGVTDIVKYRAKPGICMSYFDTEVAEMFGRLTVYRVVRGYVIFVGHLTFPPAENACILVSVCAAGEETSCGYGDGIVLGE
jgi:hypothetical protein